MRHFILVLSLLAVASISCNLGSAPVQPTRIAAQPTLNTTIAATLVISTSAPIASPTSQPIASNPTISCTARTDWPTYIVVSGDTLGSIANRSGSTVDILTAANCLANPNALVAGQQLRVPVIPVQPTPTSDLCPGNVTWFFTFNAGAIDRLCPLPVETRSAVGEDFEGGRMLWYGSIPTDSDQRPTIWVIYNEGDWETFPDTWEASQPSNDPALVPPANRFQPVRGFGKVWRDNPNVRQRLGWAYETETPFFGRMQGVVEPNPRPSGYVAHWYLDHGKAGIVLRMYSVDMAPNRWELAGSYPH